MIEHLKKENYTKIDDLKKAHAPADVKLEKDKLIEELAKELQKEGFVKHKNDTEVRPEFQIPNPTLTS